ncbi:MAG: porin family protein [Bacteroidota bacterium]
MKKKCFFIFLVLLSVVAVHAQQVNIGVKADLNYFRVNGDGMSQQFNAGVSGGGYAEIKINDKWSIQPELLYSQRNTRAKDFSKYFSASASLSASNDAFLSYISVPVVVKYKFYQNWSISAGAQYNYLVYADEDLLKDGKEAFKKNDIGVVAGVDYAVSKRVGFYGRFYYGLNDINNINTFHVWNAQEFKVGIAFSLVGYKQNK